MTVNGTADASGTTVDVAQRRVGEPDEPLSSTASTSRDLVAAPSSGHLPVPLSWTKQAGKRRWWLRLGLALVFVAAGSGAAYYWWQRLHPPLPPGIVFGNGRLDSDEINIDTKYAARILEILADEGDMVKSG